MRVPLRNFAVSCLDLFVDSAAGEGGWRVPVSVETAHTISVIVPPVVLVVILSNCYGRPCNCFTGTVVADVDESR